MSLSNPSNHILNPAEKYILWHGKQAYLYYYDKEKGENIKIAIPFRMIVLDQLSCVAGFHKQTQSNIYSNQVRNTKTDPIVVKTSKGGFSWEGIYKEIITQIPGGKFFKSIYVAIRLPEYDDFIIANLKLHGAAQWEWSQFVKANKEHIEKVGAVSVSGFSAATEGGLDYVIPVFKTEQITKKETLDQAIELDKKLQAYLSSYLKQKPEETREDEPEFEPPDEAYTTNNLSPSDAAVDDLPF